MKIDLDYIPTWDKPDATAASHYLAAIEISAALGLEGEQEELAHKLIISVLQKEENALIIGLSKMILFWKK